jgi:hypothetical protein
MLIHPLSGVWSRAQEKKGATVTHQSIFLSYLSFFSFGGFVVLPVVLGHVITEGFTARLFAFTTRSAVTCVRAGVLPHWKDLI